MAKQVIYGMVLLVLMISAFALEESKEIQVSFPQEVNAITMNKEAPAPYNFPKPLSFTTEPTNSLRCTYKSQPARSYIISSGGSTSSVNAQGGACLIKQYIKFYQCTDSGCGTKSPLFNELWYRSALGDLIDYSDYWTKNLGNFYVTYGCYSCAIEGTPVSSYTCWNNEWRGEPGTQYEGVSGNCDSGCKKQSTTLKTVDRATIIQEMCNDLIVNPPPPSISPPSPVPTPCIDCGGIPPPSPVPLSGSWTNIRVPYKVNPDEKFKVTASFTANTAGTYYLEGGIESTPKTLAITSVETSKCDGDTHWAGDFYILSAGESVEIDFNILSRTQPGLYGITIGAYSGCLNAGGAVVTKTAGFVEVLGKDKGGDDPIYCDIPGVDCHDDGNFSLSKNILFFIAALLIAGAIWFWGRR